MTFDGRIEAQFAVPSGVTLTATNGSGGPTSVPLLAGSYYPSTFLTMLASQLNAAQPSGWTATLSTGASGTGLVTINGTGTWSLAFTTTTVRDLLGFTADITSMAAPQTGTKQCRGLWIPDCTFIADIDPRAAPKASDLRTTTSPTGVVLGLIGNIRYRHTNPTWSHVLSSKIWEALVTYANASFEFFWNETQFGLGLSWFTPSSKIQIYDHTGTLVGLYGNSGAGLAGWWITGVTDIAPKPVVAGWAGVYSVTFPEIVSSG